MEFFRKSKLSSDYKLFRIVQIILFNAYLNPILRHVIYPSVKLSVGSWNSKVENDIRNYDST